LKKILTITEIISTAKEVVLAEEKKKKDKSNLIIVDEKYLKLNYKCKQIAFEILK